MLADKIKSSIMSTWIWWAICRTTKSQSAMMPRACCLIRTRLGTQMQLKKRVPWLRRRFGLASNQVRIRAKLFRVATRMAMLSSTPQVTSSRSNTFSITTFTSRCTLRKERNKHQSRSKGPKPTWTKKECKKPKFSRKRLIRLESTFWTPNAKVSSTRESLTRG